MGWDVEDAGLEGDEDVADGLEDISDVGPIDDCPARHAVAFVRLVESVLEMLDCGHASEASEAGTHVGGVAGRLEDAECAQDAAATKNVSEFAVS